MNLSRYNKAIASFLGATITAVPIGFATAAGWWAAILPVVTTLFTYFSKANTVAPDTSAPNTVV